MAINHERLKERRIELGMTQQELVNQVRLLSGGLGQSGYVRIEKGQADKSRYLPYICQVLGLKMSEVDSRIGEVNEEAERMITHLLRLPEKERLVIARRVLESLTQ